MISPNVYSIPASQPFLDCLATGILDLTDCDSLRLSRVRVLLPTRRSCRALREVFLRLTAGKPMLLPRMTPLGDVDEEEIFVQGSSTDPIAFASVPPAIPPRRRQLILTHLILARGTGESPDQAARLAEELGRLQDQVDVAGLGFDGLAKLVPGEFAEHWEKTLKFLDVLTCEWTALMRDQGCVGGAARRNLLLKAQADAWRSSPPADIIIAAGSTGSIPATAAVLKVIASLPGGYVVLPGLDQEMDDESRAALTPSHPQFGLRQLLANLEIDAGAVAQWPYQYNADGRGMARQRLVAEALRPASTVDAWRDFTGPDPEALDGVTLLESGGPSEEAGAIALLMREALETPGRTAALVTPDRQLARRVSVELARWNITIDDSGGVFLRDTLPGSFLRLCLGMVAQRMAPSPLLALLKHPLAGMGRPAAALSAVVADLERGVLRGPRPGDLVAAVQCGAANGVAGCSPSAVSLANDLAQLASEFSELLEAPGASFEELLRVHIRFAEAVAATADTSGEIRLWAGESGDAAARFIADLAENAQWMPTIPGIDYPALFDVLINNEVVRNQQQHHPRLSIWGPLEARLQRTDLLILGGLNEGTWPADPAADPWMSRPMRENFGLSPVERQIGQAAHDFTQAFCAPEIVLTRATRVDGTPTVRSRWLERLLTLVGGTDVLAGRQNVLDWQRHLDDPVGAVQPIAPPMPCPPVSARPRALSVTQVELWMRDPYALYARHILKLKPLDPIDADPGVADYGTITHEALETFVRRYPAHLPGNALDELLATGREVFQLKISQPGVWAFWWPRFERIAAWFVESEGKRRGEVRHLHCEASGSLVVQGPAGPFTISAKADRIEERTDGTLALVDYKTGTPPAWPAVSLGFAPQLPLEAIIAQHGGFSKVPAVSVSGLEYWHLSGGATAGNILVCRQDPKQLAEDALAGVSALVAKFDDPNTPYACQPRPDWAPRYGDYDHLARVREWSTSNGGNG